MAGWIKRGPTGFIGTNKSCAQQTVQELLDDLYAGGLDRSPRDPDAPLRVLHSRGVHPVGLAGWRALDAEERRRGAVQGRPRSKVVDLDEMRRLAVPSPARAGLARAGRR